MDLGIVMMMIAQERSRPQKHCVSILPDRSITSSRHGGSHDYYATPHIELGSTMLSKMHKLMVMCLSSRLKACHDLPLKACAQITAGIPCQTRALSFERTFQACRSGCGRRHPSSKGGKFVVEGRACFIHGFGGYMKLMVANHVHARL